MKLAHFRYLDYRFATNVSRTEQRVSILGPELRRRGAPDLCHVVSEDPDEREHGVFRGRRDMSGV